MMKSKYDRDFGDNNESHITSPKHAFSSVDNFSVLLKTVDDDGNVNIKNQVSGVTTKRRLTSDYGTVNRHYINLGRMRRFFLLSSIEN